jgi:hypothetical protein
VAPLLSGFLGIYQKLDIRYFEAIVGGSSRRFRKAWWEWALPPRPLFLHRIFESERPDRVRAFLTNPAKALLNFVPSVNRLKIRLSTAGLPVDLYFARVQLHSVE